MLRIFFILSMCQIAAAQKNHLDFVVTKSGDTVYGVIKPAVYDDFALIETVVGDKPMSKEHSLRSTMAFRRNGKIYQRRNQADDPIYGGASEKSTDQIVVERMGKFLTRSARLPDFAITITGDTIFGDVKGSVILSSGKKIRLDQSVKRYREDNRLYDLKNVRSGFGDNRTAFAQCLVDGKMKLYKYTTVGNASIHLDQPTDYYFIEKDRKLTAVDSQQTLESLVADKPELVQKIQSGEYGPGNLYLVVNYYNEKN